MKILSIGEIIFDIYGSEAVIGGAPLNFCAHCARLGAESSLISAVGTDEYSAEALAYLEKFGVDSSFVKKSELPTGKCIVSVDEKGVPSYDVVRPAAYDDIVLGEEDINKIKNLHYNVFAFGTLVQREPGSRKALLKILESCKFEHIFCDVNLRNGCYDEESCLVCLKNADIIKISDEEEPLLRCFGGYSGSDDEKELLKNIAGKYKNIRIILYTKGSCGSVIYDAASDSFFAFDAPRTQVVSTVGAGDSYSAAFLCEYLESGDISGAGEAGTRLSAYVVSRREAIPD